jgi:ribosome biogenesis GTPase A
VNLDSKDPPLEQIARLRNFLVKHENPDLNRAALTFLKDVREGRIGCITLDVAIL